MLYPPLFDRRSGAKAYVGIEPGCRLTAAKPGRIFAFGHHRVPTLDRQTELRPAIERLVVTAAIKAMAEGAGECFAQVERLSSLFANPTFEQSVLSGLASLGFCAISEFPASDYNSS